MNAAGASPPTLRCLSCGYDVGSLVEQRGRDEPGVCPECGVDLTETLNAPDGLPVQRSWSARDYLRFVRDATLHPLRTADRFNAKDPDGPLLFVNCLAGGFSAFLLCAGGGFVRGVRVADMSMVGWGVFGGMGFALITVTALALIAWPIVFLLDVIAAVFGSAMSMTRAYAAMEIASVWFAAWPWSIAAACLLLVFSGRAPPFLPIEEIALALVFLPPVVTIAVGVAVRLRLARHSLPDEPANPQPSAAEEAA